MSNQTNNLTPRQNEKITKFLLGMFQTEIENALHGTGWQDLMESLQGICYPQDIFDAEELGEWAEANGYEKKAAPVDEQAEQAAELSDLRYGGCR